MIKTGTCRTVALLMLAALALSACAVGQGAAPETVKVRTGKVLEAAAKQFISTARLYDRLFDEQLVTAEEYKVWAEFAPRFQKAFASAYTTWVLMPDDATSFDTETITAAVDELTLFYLRARKKLGTSLWPSGGGKLPRFAESGGGE